MPGDALKVIVASPRSRRDRRVRPSIDPELMIQMLTPIQFYRIKARRGPKKARVRSERVRAPAGACRLIRGINKVVHTGMARNASAATNGRLFFSMAAR